MLPFQAELFCKNTKFIQLFSDFTPLLCLSLILLASPSACSGENSHTNMNAFLVELSAVLIRNIGIIVLTYMSEPVAGSGCQGFSISVYDPVRSGQCSAPGALPCCRFWGRCLRVACTRIMPNSH